MIEEITEGWFCWQWGAEFWQGILPVDENVGGETQSYG